MSERKWAHDIITGALAGRKDAVTTPRLNQALEHVGSNLRVTDEYRRLFDGSLSRQIALKNKNEVVLGVEGPRVSPRDLLQKAPHFWADLLKERQFLR